MFRNNKKESPAYLAGDSDTVVSSVTVVSVACAGSSASGATSSVGAGGVSAGLSLQDARNINEPTIAKAKSNFFMF